MFEVATDGGTAAFHDINGYTKFIFPSNHRNDNSELFFTIPAGFSMMTDSGKLVATGYGFNVGGLFGGNYFFTNYFGLTGQAGYVYRRINSEMVAAPKEKVTFNIHEIVLNLGLVVRF